jgi:hypothetical protein
MAKAKLTKRYVEEVVLTLIKDEAQFLYDVLQTIGGCPKRSRRRLETSISDSLKDVGCHDTTYPDDHTGTIEFKDVYK